VPIQLPAFPDAASLIRVRPERNEWRFYRMEFWPDLFGRAPLVRQWGRIDTSDPNWDTLRSVTDQLLATFPSSHRWPSL